MTKTRGLWLLMPLLAWSQASGARVLDGDASSEIECVSRAVSASARSALVTQSASGAVGSEYEAATRHLATTARSCATTHGWSEFRMRAAVNYALGYVMIDDVQRRFAIAPKDLAELKRSIAADAALVETARREAAAGPFLQAFVERNRSWMEPRISAAHNPRLYADGIRRAIPALAIIVAAERDYADNQEAVRGEK